MKVNKTELDGVLEIDIECFKDHRGEYIETYNEQIYKDNGVEVNFVQDDYSRSKKGVFRGIHGDKVTWKLVSCLQGSIKLVVVNCKKGDKNFGKHEIFDLSQDNHKQVLIPPGYGNGHYVETEEAIFHYKQSTYYEPSLQFSYRYDEKEFNITWPVGFNPITSKRDS
ncbi:dTDP-4-dehydrorhamnose 3,5-epimerase family protein [Halobacteriovorax sp. HLS]|uniref:dTDP-4-dehydrorhamnose 3,5-epimerase family protein n=1 Tax=Halobacteriovorax sp. HLS TaxID=2234000 RepID=UPI000FD90DB8|nr:dTDP-4-dehydrorhamnose 3,5-epimerase family protein [Halobacteriovorax sp. HLS]